MTNVSFGLISSEGDQLGHLVRGVQMLRSYGKEADIERYSDVVYVANKADEPPRHCVVITGQTDTTPEGLDGICRETEWALGKEPSVLQVFIVDHDGKRPRGVPPELVALAEGKRIEGGMLSTPGDEFARLCDWGQKLVDGETEVMGEWPSATGR